MAEDGKTEPDAPAGGKGGSGAKPESAWAGLLKAAGQRLVPLVVSTGSLLTFVAFAGAVIVWTRLNAVEVAPDQAITAFPRGELVAIGASLLLLYGFFGALAVLGAFLIDRGGRPTQGMAYGLLFLFAAEGITAITTAADFGSRDWGIAMLLFAFPVGFAAWAASLGLFSELRDELHRRPMETRPRKMIWGGLRPKPTFVTEGEARDKAKSGSAGRQESPPAKSRWRRAADAAPREVWLSCLFASIALVAAGVLLAVRAGSLARLVGVAIPVALLLLTVACAIWRSLDATREEREEERWDERKQNTHLAKEEQAWSEAEMLKRVPGDLDAHRGAENLRLARKRPCRLYLTWPGIAVVVPSLLLAAGLPAWQLGEPWLGIALAGAAVICMWLWRIAIFTRDRLIWFGLAVFLAVPLFGTFMNMARNLDDPQIQPIALIRSTDGPDESIHGLYVTEAKDRVYFATVATEGCTSTLRENSGRLLWVPKDEVVAMSIGPLQSVQDAARTSLEMAFALTPAVETPSGENVSLTSGESRSEEGGLGEEAPLTVQRLENVGSAVRPTFGRGARLEPADARPGEVVTLVMSTPIKDGFGVAREGRNVRVGGTPARIVVNPTDDGERAEYLEDEEGGRLVLDKKLDLYVPSEDGEGFEREDDPPASAERFVKLSEDSGVVAVSAGGEDQGLYVKLTHTSSGDRVAGGQTVDYASGEEGVKLDSGLWRQAWNKDAIKFYVPEKGVSSTVTVDCEQLAGQPLLRVERPPEARVSVREGSSGRTLALDSSRSADDGKIRARRWALDGLPLTPPWDGRRSGGETGSTAKAKKKAAKRRENEVKNVARISLRRGSHRVRLAVEDDDGEIDTASIYVLRIPDGRALEGKQGKARVERLRAVFARLAGSGEAPGEVWIDGYGGSPGKHGRGSSSLSAAMGVFENMLTARSAREAGLEGAEVTVHIRGFGASCRAVPSGGDSIDITIVDEGVKLLPPKRCPARRVAKQQVWSSEGATPLAGPSADSRPNTGEALARLLEAAAEVLR